MLLWMCETVMSYQFRWCLFGIAEISSFQEKAVLVQQKDMKLERGVQETGKNSLSNKSGMLLWVMLRLLENGGDDIIVHFLFISSNQS